MYSVGDKLPESTGDDSPNSVGEALSDCAGKILTPLGISCTLPGSILILRWVILRLPWISSLFSADGR